MILDKTLLLKGVAGVATLGGVVAGGFVFKDQIKDVFSGSSVKDSVDQRGNGEGTAREDNLGSDNKSQGAQGLEPRDGVGSGALVSDSSSTPESTEDAYGIPKTCTSTCELNEEELKKIKFEGLGEEKTPEVTVDNFPTETDKKITLTIDSTDSTKNRYIFTNTSDKEVIIKRDESKKVTLKVGKTKFTVASGKLKERELNDYGLPKEGCTNSCTLTSTDLEDIKFKDLDGGSGDITVSPNTGKVSLEIKNVNNTNRYIFSNSSGKDVTISKGNSNTVTLTSAKKTQFTVESDNKLSKLALDTHGIPTSCSTTSPCTLTADDLGEIKFEELDGTGTVSPTTGNVSLKIDSSDTTNKRFTFENSGSSITIQKPSDASKKVTLAKGKTRFKANNDKLKEIKLNSYGLPQDCTESCKLTEDDLKEVKFPGFEDNHESKVTGLDEATITLTITEGEEYSFADDQGKSVTIQRGNNSVSLTPSTGTYFHAENGKLVKGKKKSEAEKFNEKIKKAGFPCDGDEDNGCCKFKDGNTSQELECKLTKDQFKVLKFKELDGGEVDESTLNNGIGNEFKVKIKKISDEEKGNYSQGSDLKFIFDGLSNSFTIQKKDDGSKTIYLKKNSNTEFIVNSSGVLERAWNRLTLGNKLGLSCNGSSAVECTIPESQKINLIASSNPSQKYEQMTKSGSGEAKFQVTTGDNYKEGYRFKVKDSDITLSSSSGGSQTLTKECCYEAKWEDRKWWLAWKENSCSR